MTFRVSVTALAAAAGLAASLAWGVSCARAEPGSVIWEVVYSGETAEEGCLASGLALDEQGNVFVAGTLSEKAGGKDYLTLKYGPDGAARWARRYNHSWYDAGRAVAADLIGEAVVAGASDNLQNPRDTWSNSYYTDYRVVKYDPSGEVMYEMAASGNGKNNDPASVAVDYDGDIYVTGYAYNAAGSYPVFYTVKFSATGKLLWERYEDWGAEAKATCVKVDADGSVLVTGYLLDPVNYDHNIKLMRYAADGRTLMEVTYDHHHEDEKARGLAVDKDGNIIVAGETGSPARMDIAQPVPLPSSSGSMVQPMAQDTVTLLLKFNQQGKLVWSESYGKSDYRNQGLAVAVDPYRRIYIAGKTFKTGPTGDVLLLVYGGDGRLLDDRTYTYGGDDYPAGIGLDQDGNTVMACTVNQPNTPGVIRTVKLAGYPPPEPAVSLAMAFNPSEPMTLREPPRRMLRKVELTGTTTDIIEGSPVVVFRARVVGPPGEYEYRFFISDKDSPEEGDWTPVTGYSGTDHWEYRPGRWTRKAVKVMVRVRPKGSVLEYEASQTVEYTP